MLKHSIAHEIAVPNMGALTMRGFVDTVFGNFPEARPGGAPGPVQRKGWFARLFGRR